MVGDDIKVGLTRELHVGKLRYEWTFPYRHARIGDITSRETNSRGLDRPYDPNVRDLSDLREPDLSSHAAVPITF